MPPSKNDDIAQRLTRVEAALEALDDRVKGNERDLRGNGRPGLVEQFPALRQDVRRGFKILTALVAIVGGGGIAWNQFGTTPHQQREEQIGERLDEKADALERIERLLRERAKRDDARP